jgi:hypothetical protein
MPKLLHFRAVGNAFDKLVARFVFVEFVIGALTVAALPRT